MEVFLPKFSGVDDVVMESASTVMNVNGEPMKVFICTDKIIEANNLQCVSNPINFANIANAMKGFMTQEGAEVKKVLNEIKNNKHWRELPIMERLQEGIIFNIDKSMKFPIVENGYWFYLDRHTEANDIYDEYERYEEKRSSTNFSVAVFDLDSNILYYYALDT